MPTQFHVRAASSSTIGILSAVMSFTTTRMASLRRVRRGSPSPVHAEGSWSCRMREVNSVCRSVVQLDIESDPQSRTSHRVIVVANALVVARSHVNSVIVRPNDLMIAVSGTTFVVGTYTTRGYP